MSKPDNFKNFSLRNFEDYDRYCFFNIQEKPEQEYFDFVDKYLDKIALYSEPMEIPVTFSIFNIKMSRIGGLLAFFKISAILYMIHKWQFTRKLQN